MSIKNRQVPMDARLRLRMLLTVATSLSTLALPAEAEPTTADACLSASQAALDLANTQKLRAERDQLLLCAAATCPSEVRLECQRRIDEVNVALASIVFTVRDASGHDLTAVKITMDGDMLANRLDGTAIEIEPGEHQFRFEALGQVMQERRIDVRKAEKGRHELIVFQPTPPVERASSVQRSSPAIAAPRAINNTPAIATDNQRKLAYLMGGFGLVGIGVGTAYGLTAISRKHAAEARCPHQCADVQGAALWDSAQAAGNVATLAWVVGGIGLSTGVVLWATAKPHSSALARLSIGPGDIRLAGAF